VKRFARLFDELDASTGTLDKVAALRSYFADADPADAAWAVAVLGGRKLVRAVSSTRLRAWASEVSGYPPWLIAACHEATGDLSEALALLVGNAERAGADREAASQTADEAAVDSTGTADLPLHRVVIERVLPLAEMNQAQQRETVTRTWHEFGDRERLLYHKLISTSFRVGVQKKLVVRALAEHAGLEPATVALRWSGSWTPSAEAFNALIAPEPSDGEAGHAEGVPGVGSPAAIDRPYPFCLAYPLDVDTDKLGGVDQWLIERKWDGIRAQAIRRGASAYLWSRGDELVTPAFPEVEAAMRSLDRDAVLDGELLAWDHDAPLPFTALQKRLNRKRVEPSLFPDVPIVFMAYDLLELDAVDTRDLPLSERRSRLETLLAHHDDAALRLSPTVSADSWKQVEAEVADARRLGVEGVMLKRLDSVYGVGRQRGQWWKWKTQPYTVDAVLVQAEQGHGRRAGLYTAYTFAVWDHAPTSSTPPTPASQRLAHGEPRLVNVTRAYSGLTHDEIEKLDRWIRDHTTAKHGPARLVEPHHVFEIAFEGLQRSPRHKAGLALRFPRMNRWRRDKAIEDADTLDTLRALLPREPA